ncbi:MAG: hypothetical protein J6334_10295 [Kiritimatiellae bacterium]|nr:hypothetical protein [Kiritimatiellia bacterium]
MGVWTVGTLWAIEPCRVEVVERGSGWPVPLVELQTTHALRFVTDNAGIIALDAPELMGREVWFTIHGHGYGVKKDGFGYAGMKLTPEPGKRIRVEVERTIIARRLGRLTGGGIFAESQKCGERLAWRESGDFGCDTVQTAVYGGRVYWVWGDTTMPHYPLGIFDALGATSPLPPFPRLEPPIEPPFTHFRNGKGILRPVAKALKTAGPTWIFGTVTLRDETGRERLCASYTNIRPRLTPTAVGQCVWNDRTERFELLQELWRRPEGEQGPPPRFTDGHPVFWTDGEGKRWLLFGDPFPRLKCPATFEGWKDRERWEMLTPQREVPSLDGSRQVKPHTGSIVWSGFRKRWVTVFMEKGGTPSNLGELWYAEADSPFGPWKGAVKILSHDNYTFYNPLIHTEGRDPDSPILLFEGTYTQSFANRPHPTPRYDYTQILYRLDLDDPRLTTQPRRGE